MKISKNVPAHFIAAAALACLPAYAAVQITELRALPKSSQPVGTSIKWTVAATDSNPGPLTFQFNVAAPGGQFVMARDFNVGLLESGVWQPPTKFTWTPTGIEGAYQIQVIAKDFVSGETAEMTAQFQVDPLVTGSLPVAVPTANPLVALFSAPSCSSGGKMRVSFQPQAGNVPATVTNWMDCDGTHSMTFEIAGMYPSTTYEMISQTLAGLTSMNSPPVFFTTGALPANVQFPPLQIVTGASPITDTADSMLLHAVDQLGGGTHYPDVATDLSNNIIWFYIAGSSTDLMTRPLQNGAGFLSLQSGAAWNPASSMSQTLRQYDWAGNLVRETNTGILQQELLAMGATDAAPCDSFPSPAPVGSACLGAFHHDAIQTLPNGYTAVLTDVEKIFPPGTQGDTSGLPVDIMGDIIIVLDENWKPFWYFDTFDHDTGAPQLDINRPAVLANTCVDHESGCPPIFLLSEGIAPRANDWLHANCLYYWPAPQDGGTSGDIVWSSRHQDFVLKIDYQDGAGTGNILWRLGPGGDFQFNNVNADPWPWFSHQHEVAIENNGEGPLSLLDNGNTRVSPPHGRGSSTGGTPGLGPSPACLPSDCNSRGMALMIDQTFRQVTPVVSQDLGYYSSAMGSAQLLSNGNYFFLAAFVLAGSSPRYEIAAGNHPDAGVDIRVTDSYSMEIHPIPGTVTGTPALNLKSTAAYRVWQMPSLYAPPIS